MMTINSKGGKKYKRTKKFTSNQKNREFVLKKSDQKYGFLTEERKILTVVYNNIMKELEKKSITVEFESCNNILDDDVRRYVLEFL